MNAVTTHSAESALDVLIDDAALVIISASAALLAACHEPSISAVASGERVALVHARARACAGTFARLAADLLLRRQQLVHDANESVAAPEPPGGIELLSARDLWRITVLDLACAVQGAHELRVAIQADGQFLPLGSMLRQLTSAADRLAVALETGEPVGAHTGHPVTPTMRLPEVEAVEQGRSNRRRPWFGAGN